MQQRHRHRDDSDTETSKGALSIAVVDDDDDQLEMREMNGRLSPGSCRSATILAAISRTGGSWISATPSMTSNLAVLRRTPSDSGVDQACFWLIPPKIKAS